MRWKRLTAFAGYTFAQLLPTHSSLSVEALGREAYSIDTRCLQRPLREIEPSEASSFWACPAAGRRRAF